MQTEKTPQMPPDFEPHVYMVLVEGRGEPKKFHFEFAEAMKEAMRLAGSEAPRMVTILAVVCRYQAKVVVDKVPLPEEIF